MSGASSQAPRGAASPVHGDFPRIGELAFLSDCHTGALVAPDGGVEWLCLPRFDSPSVCGALLDRDAGRLRFAPRAEQVPVARRYLPGTNILETTWSTGRGWVVVLDALTVGPWRERADDPHVRPPGDEDAEQILVRVATCVQGEVELELFCDLRPGYGAEQLDWELSEDFSGATATLPDGTPLALGGDMRLSAQRHGGLIEARRRLRDGDACCVCLAWGSDPDMPRDAAEAQRRLEHTGDFWRDWLGNGHFPDHPWRVHLQRSAVTLKGLSHAPTGALLAAATTSLPETPGGSRNWDYRFTWIRDATFALWGLHTLGFDAEARDFTEFVGDVCRDVSELQIMYGIDGRKDLAESTLDALSGYENAKPVRIGNGAASQRQNDVYGALLDSLYIHTKTQDRVPHGVWQIADQMVDAAARIWSEPDQGIWEARGEPRHYVSSKLMCWVALDRGTRLAESRGESEQAERWGRIADEIKAEILEKGVTAEGVLRQHYDTDALDASNLLAPLVRFLPPSHEVIRNTVLATQRDLTEHGLVLRYRTDETDDGQSGVEGTFTICSFWLASALSEIGETEAARALCEKLLSMSGDLDLYAEEIEPVSGLQLGNFPQAFTHLALINAVSHVIADELSPATGDGGMTAGFSQIRGMGAG
ncbi:glycoside hydrolase family 15 protein [Thermoleophilia bacterium SCSIO 60948]|nr:glycoside hydrolase family 15 protein [Thermoleophilia bacterium SCSIO 60948]